MVVYRRIEFANAGWKGRIFGIVAAALGLGLALALIVLSVGLAIVLLPLIVMAWLIGRWRWNKLAAEARKDREKRDGPVIELDYEVVDKRRP